MRESLERAAGRTLESFPHVLFPDELTLEEMGQAAQLRAGEVIIIAVVLVMWAGKQPICARTPTIRSLPEFRFDLPTDARSDDPNAFMEAVNLTYVNTSSSLFESEQFLKKSCLLPLPVYRQTKCETETIQQPHSFALVKSV